MASEQTRVADRLARLRESHSLTQETAAGRTGVTLRQWQRWESGESEPYARNIARISDEFKIPLAELVGAAPESEPSQFDRIESELNRQGDLLDALVDGLEAALSIDVRAHVRRAAPQAPGTLRAVDPPAQG